MNISDNFNPFEFKCNYCNNVKNFTMGEIEKIKVKTPGTDGT